MKRIIVGLLAALLSFAGLVSFSAQSATAACPYTNCVTTSLSVGAGVRVSDSQASYAATVTSAGNDAPRGQVVVRATRNQAGGGGETFESRGWVTPGDANTSSVTVKTQNLPRGAYTIRISFDPATNTVFKSDSIASRQFRSL